MKLQAIVIMFKQKKAIVTEAGHQMSLSVFRHILIVETSS